MKTLRSLLILTIALVILPSSKLKADDGPQIAVMDFNGIKPLLNKNDDTVRVINFWATWCVPCVKELPDFEKINSEYFNKNVKVILVSLDFPEQIQSRLLPFIEKKDLRSEIVLLDEPDGNKWIELVDTDWSGAIPATVIYKGRHSKFHEGMMGYDELQKIVDTMLKH